MRDENTEDIVAPELRGLSSEEVAQRLADGLTNAYAGPKTKSVGQIAAEHTFTLFNGVNLVLAGLVALTGSWRNLSYIVVVFANLFIGVFQEVRSKRTIDKLSILAERPVIIRRDGRDVCVSHEEVVLDDLLVLSRGDQIPADAQVVWGEAGVNESLLTGESKPVTKVVGSELMSGSFLDSGTLVARVTRVGADSYASRINAEAKYVKGAKSEIMATLNMIIRWATWLLAPVGILLFLRTLQDGSTINQAILTTVAALVGMIPQGLVLLTSSVLAISTVRLARKSVLIQQFYCIEMLARVDVLCLDKTGTITSGSMDFEQSVGVCGHDSSEVELAAAAIVRASAHDANETATAIIRYTTETGIDAPAAKRAIGFSSARKYSGCVLGDGRALVMGAAQFVFSGGVPDEVAQALAQTGERARTLVVAECDGFDADGNLLGAARPLGILSLSDHIRANAPATIAYFVEQGVTLNVISGDDPRTVAGIAAEAGVPDADKWVDASTLTTPEALKRAAMSYHVFGRVTPQQKRELVQALRHAGHTVAMTGDGVNDVLALREADCSVAMASGSDAARNVAEVVLVDNDFAHMPAVVAEGRRSINNLQRSASLFLVKTVFSAVLALLCALIPPYPFQPVQMSLISTAIIGIPSFVLALEPNHERVRGSFLGNVLARSMPGSIAVILAVGVASGVLERFGLSRMEVSTVCVLLTCLVGFSLIVRISLPLNALRSALLVVVVGIIAFGCTVAGRFFEISPLTPTMLVSIAIIGAVALVIFNFLFTRGVELARGDEGYESFMRTIENHNERRDDHGSDQPC
ncbi:HAD-IC family P-type ATPase [uncultured Parolsenella sp.]|uniref:HAD-IC family P-type ATPase n=1 Tax=uncultured Parolsenella sp. TaxID=2083008 RepID=UPI0027DBDC6F|nr:HAD-IC family P-type ATPase [uncultured Parolsenella sp.]